MPLNKFGLIILFAASVALSEVPGAFGPEFEHDGVKPQNTENEPTRPTGPAKPKFDSPVKGEVPTNTVIGTGPTGPAPTSNNEIPINTKGRYVFDFNNAAKFKEYLDPYPELNDFKAYNAQNNADTIDLMNVEDMTMHMKDGQFVRLNLKDGGWTWFIVQSGRLIEIKKSDTEHLQVRGELLGYEALKNYNFKMQKQIVYEPDQREIFVWIPQKPEKIEFEQEQHKAKTAGVAALVFGQLSGNPLMSAHGAALLSASEKNHSDKLYAKIDSSYEELKAAFIKENYGDQVRPQTLNKPKEDQLNANEESGPLEPVAFKPKGKGKT